MYGGGHAYILVSWKVYMRSSQILYIILASLTLPSFVFGDQGEYISSCLFYLLSVLRGLCSPSTQLRAKPYEL